MTRPVAHLPDRLREEMIDHCQSELPNEACGLVGLDGDEVVAIYPARNIEHSPTSYTVDPADHFAALVDAESNGWRLGGVYHSHPNGHAVMSSVDLETAVEPDWIYIVVGMSDPKPVVKISRRDD